jgi:hypothetical protein
MSSAPLRTTSRALRAASRALAASTALSMILRAVFGFSSKNWPSFSLTTVSTIPFTSLETSLALVCESKEGSGCLTAMTAVSPSRTSSPSRPCLTSLSRFCAAP